MEYGQKRTEIAARNGPPHEGTKRENEQGTKGTKLPFSEAVTQLIGFGLAPANKHGSAIKERALGGWRSFCFMLVFTWLPCFRNTFFKSIMMSRCDNEFQSSQGSWAMTSIPPELMRFGKCSPNRPLCWRSCDSEGPAASVCVGVALEKQAQTLLGLLLSTFLPDQADSCLHLGSPGPLLSPV